MKKFLMAMTLLLSTGIVFAEELYCSVNLNGETVVENTFTLEPKTKIAFAEVQGFRFFITNKSESKFELDIFNPADPSRSYSEGFLRTNKDIIGWSLWSRDILIETSCKLID